jgi:hypothetical protein
MSKKILISVLFVFLTGFLSLGAAPRSPEISYSAEADLSPTATIRKDLLENYCDATWYYGSGKTLSCPGNSTTTAGSTNGFVVLVKTPKLENGTSSKSVLWVHPQNKTGGKISGSYPGFLVKKGDHFKAKVGCMGGYSKCNMIFSLRYRIGNNPVQTLGTWKEVNGGGITAIDIDLSQLAGKKIHLILRAESNKNPDAAQGFWMVPVIVNNK